MQLSLFSISYAGLWGQAALDVRQFIRRAGELGFDAVMLAGKRPHLSPLDTDDGLIVALRNDLREAGVKCAVVAAYTDLAGAAASEVPFLEMQIAYAEALCRIGGQLGAPVLRVFTAYEVAGGSPQALWSQAVTWLRETCDRAAQHGLTVAIQNHHDLAVHTAALLELLHDVGRPNCKLAFDAWSPALRGEDVYEAARLAGPHTAITTNADYVCLPRFRYRPELVNYEPVLPPQVRAVPFGTGSIDYVAFFEGLKAGGFDGPATYEMCSPIRDGGSLDNLDRCARTYVRWMREHGLR
ncbi:MAG TPA: sugar phosphate isomerase/epimerase family protein [Gemmataceae bacterium]|nr:sugar phosphate isomerase/epimerase family protein [Gemmataceae bacterium]